MLDEYHLPKPDVVVSGINHGRNTAVNIIYSGTVSAATEGTVLDVPSIAISLTSYKPDADFALAASFAKQFVPHVVAQGLPRGTLLNVNVPPVPESELNGVAYTKQGSGFWDDMFEKRLDPQERPYYWLKGHYNFAEAELDSDDVAIRKNMISITPLHYDLTNHEFLENIRSKWPTKF